MDCSNCLPCATQCYIDGQKVILDDPLDTKNLKQLKKEYEAVEAINPTTISPAES